MHELKKLALSNPTQLLITGLKPDQPSERCQAQLAGRINREADIKAKLETFSSTRTGMIPIYDSVEFRIEQDSLVKSHYLPIVDPKLRLMMEGEGEDISVPKAVSAHFESRW